MPFGHKDPDILVAEILMIRTIYHGALLVVEGPNDCRFWSAPGRAVCQLIVGEGKNNVVGCIERLDRMGSTGVLGLIDDDYDSLIGVARTSLNLIATELNDLECLLCRSSALESVLVEYGNPSAIRQLEEESGVDVRTNLLSRAIIFGRLRWASRLFQLEIDVRAISVPRFVDRQTWKVDARRLAEAVLDNQVAVDQALLDSYIGKLPSADPWRVVRGHDMVQILCIGLANVLGNDRRSIGSDEISRVLRASASLAELRSTVLWSTVHVWESRNSGCSIVEQ